jgi:GT2 family glycosyltransferase
VEFDTLVVDDGSHDGTRELVNELRRTRGWSGERLRWVSTGLTPRGLSRARNVGVGNVAPSATHVVTLDADVVLEPHAIERLARASAGYPNAAVFGVVNWLPPEARRSVAATLRRGRAELLHELVPDAMPKRVEGTIIGPDPRPQAIFTSAAEAYPEPLDPALALNTFCAIPLSALAAVNGWDEALAGYGYEDMEFGARLRRNGTAAVYLADAVGFHLWHPKDWSKAAVEAERNLDYVLRRLGVDAIPDTYADWTVWWHYHRERGGSVWVVDRRYYAVNRSRTHGLPLPDSTWIVKLGHEPATVQPATNRDLAALEMVGPPRDLSISRVPHVEPLPSCV